MAVSEELVLQKKDSAIENHDDWPNFVLQRITVLLQATEEPTSLLKAHKDHPVKVIGYLDTIDAEHSHLSM